MGVVGPSLASKKGAGQSRMRKKEKAVKSVSPQKRWLEEKAESLGGWEKGMEMGRGVQKQKQQQKQRRGSGSKGNRKRLQTSDGVTGNCKYAGAPAIAGGSSSVRSEKRREEGVGE